MSLLYCEDVECRRCRIVPMAKAIATKVAIRSGDLFVLFCLSFQYELLVLEYIFVLYSVMAQLGRCVELYRSLYTVRVVSQVLLCHSLDVQTT